jgi:hypothetical protein
LADGEINQTDKVSLFYTNQLAWCTFSLVASGGSAVAVVVGLMLNFGGCCTTLTSH